MHTAGVTGPVTTIIHIVAPNERQCTPQFRNDAQYNGRQHLLLFVRQDPRRIYWETSLNETFESNEPRRVYPIESPPSTPPPPPRKLKRKLSLGMSFPKEVGVSQHICEACGQIIPAAKDTPGPSTRN